MTDRELMQQALEDICSARLCEINSMSSRREALRLLGKAADALRERLERKEHQTCNCRWDGDTQVQQCTLHEAHVDAIHEWAERAKAAEQKLKARQEPAAWLYRDHHNTLKLAQTEPPPPLALPVYTAPQPAIPEGYALIAIDALKAWGKYDEVRDACRYPIAAAQKEMK